MLAGIMTSLASLAFDGSKQLTLGAAGVAGGSAAARDYYYAVERYAALDDGIAAQLCFRTAVGTIEFLNNDNKIDDKKVTGAKVRAPLGARLTFD
jgi:hypothetical protein